MNPTDRQLSETALAIADEQGFFTERNPVPKSRKKSKAPRKLFRKAAIAILFLKVLKHRVIRNRPVSAHRIRRLSLRPQFENHRTYRRKPD